MTPAGCFRSPRERRSAQRRLRRPRWELERLRTQPGSPRSGRPCTRPRSGRLRPGRVLTAGARRQPQPTPPALGPSVSASWAGTRLEAFDGMRTARGYRKLGEGRDRNRDDGGRPPTERHAGQSGLIRGHRDWGGGRLQLLPEIERCPFAVSKVVSGKAGLKGTFPARQPETVPIVKV